MTKPSPPGDAPKTRGQTTGSQTTGSQTAGAQTTAARKTGLPKRGTPKSGGDTARAWVRLPSGRRLDLLSPTPFDWTDSDLAIGLSRTFRWGGHSIWPGAPLSVAQHSLLVLALRREAANGPLSASEELRELLHDAEEGLINFDCIAPLKPLLGEAFAVLSARLGAAVATRYRLPPWDDAMYRAHKRADLAAAAAEAVEVAGWSAAERRSVLGIRAPVPRHDPLAIAYDERPWQPWEPAIAERRFLLELERLQSLRET